MTVLLGGGPRFGLGAAPLKEHGRDREPGSDGEDLVARCLHCHAPWEDHVGHMRLRVVCYSGRKEDERPIRFQLGDHEYFVEEVVDQWYGPDDTFFKVRASDQNLYVLRRHRSTPEGEWSLASFRDHAAGR